MGRGAIRTAGKVMQACPRCGDRSPKELVEGERRVSWFMVTLLLLCTAGLGLLWPPLWLRRPLQAYCERCRVASDV